MTDYQRVQGNAIKERIAEVTLLKHTFLADSRVKDKQRPYIRSIGFPNISTDKLLDRIIKAFDDTINDLNEEFKAL